MNSLHTDTEYNKSSDSYFKVSTSGLKLRFVQRADVCL